jgi:hypothetical protein
VTDAERWSPIPGYEGYYSVSDHPRIRSETRRITHPGPWGMPLTRTLRGRVLKAKPSGEVTLSRGGVATTVTVQAVAAVVFGRPAAVRNSRSVAPSSRTCTPGSEAGQEVKQ